MAQYHTGRTFEWRVRDHLHNNGYSVTRSAGSKGDSKIDLMAMKPGQLLFVQCKRSGALPPHEWNRLVEVAAWVNAVPVLAATGPVGRGIVLTELLGPKVLRARTQPIRPFIIDQIADAAV